MRYRILDLETVPHPDAQQWCDPCKAPSNYKDAKKIADYIQEAEAKRAAEFGLDPDTCRIVALGFHDVGCGDPQVFLMRDEFEERHHLKLFWDSWGDVIHQHHEELKAVDWRMRGEPVFVTFNGLRFDLPVLIMRSIYLDVKYPELVIAPEWKSPHIDVWQKLSLGGARKDVKSLRFYAKRFGIGTLDRVEGADIATLAAGERWSEIEAHCLSDIGLTHALANRLKLLKLAPVAA